MVNSNWSRKVTAPVALTACILAMGAASMPAAAFVDCSQQSTLTRPIQLGVSGGNIRDEFRKGNEIECFSGTLGALIENKSNQFILSNNHVLALENKARRGQLIVQPGLVDTACAKLPDDAVATYTRTVHIYFGGPINLVDAAMAAVEPGDVSADILNIGAIASTVTAPKVGLQVQKMGRTTCLTGGRIRALHVNVIVRYQSGIATFYNQIKIGGGDFSAAGDSGSLVVTQEVCPRAVGLLFAGAPGRFTLANPISAVLKRLSPKHDELSMVGGCVPVESETEQPTEIAGDHAITSDRVEAATAVRDRHERELMRIPGAVGTGIGASDETGEPAIEVYVKKLTPEAQAAAPEKVEGVPVKLIESGAVVAY
jgi:hypothetical protein